MVDVVVVVVVVVSASTAVAWTVALSWSSSDGTLLLGVESDIGFVGSDHLGHVGKGSGPVDCDHERETLRCAHRQVTHRPLERGRAEGAAGVVTHVREAGREAVADHNPGGVGRALVGHRDGERRLFPDGN